METKIILDPAIENPTVELSTEQQLELLEIVDKIIAAGEKNRKKLDKVIQRLNLENE